MGTSDALTSLFFIKFKNDIPYRPLEMLFGGVSARTLDTWFHLVLNYVYSFSPVLLRSRNLSNVNNLRAVLEELHGATMRNTRAATSFTPTMLEVMRQNPHLGILKLVIVIWDSRHIKCDHSISFNFQKSSFSSKIGDNAVVKMVACGMDAKEKFVYMTTASISPAHTDEALCSFIMDLETNQGKYRMNYLSIIVQLDLSQG